MESEIRDVMGVMINTPGAVRSLPQYWLTLPVSFSDSLVFCVSLIPSQFPFLSLNLNSVSLSTQNPTLYKRQKKKTWNMTDFRSPAVKGFHYSADLSDISLNSTYVIEFGDSGFSVPNPGCHLETYARRRYVWGNVTTPDSSLAKHSSY